MARVLVTGGSGLLGSTLVPALRAQGHEVIVAARTPPEGGVRVDLSDAAATLRALTGIAADVIVNLAAATNVDECERDPAAAFVANAASVDHIARWVGSRDGRSHLIQLSTDQVYDGTGPHAEDAVRPLNYYAYSKLAGELYAARAGATVLRTNLFGKSRAPTRASLSDWLVERLRRRDRTTVFEDVLFSPLSLETLAALVHPVIERRPAGPFNLGSSQGMSKADFAFRLAECLGFPTDVLVRTRSSDAGLRARRPLDMRMNCGLMEATLGITLPTLATEIALMRSCYEQHA
jgi:dTDP-4-dehydrorhamnose reductase